MPRPVNCRKIETPPTMNGFKPYGMFPSKKQKIKIHFDEYESFKMVAYQNLSQEEAAAKMNISRPTLTRIYNRALQKIAKAFVECLTIEIEGGNVNFEKDWYKCCKCYKLIDGIENHTRCKKCKAFGKKELIRISQFSSNLE